MNTADILVTILGALIEFNAAPSVAPPPPPKTIKELIERELGPVKRPPFKIKRCKFPCERSA